MLIAFCILLTILVLVLLYLVYNLTNKIDLYESSIEEFYTRAVVILNTMRTLDEKQMFENDDEVGTVFQQINDAVSTLRPLIYGIPDEEEN